MSIRESFANERRWFVNISLVIVFIDRYHLFTNI